MAGANRYRELELNRLLRRADWRFLLPNPHPAKSICFTNGLLAQAVATISDQVIDPGADLVKDCDLAVAVNPSQPTLEAAWAALRPGGACYTEWYSPLSGGPARIRQRLEAAGFQQPNFYWTWPWPDRSTSLFWLPLEAPHVTDYYLANLAQTRSVSHQVREWAWRTSAKLQLVVPVCVTARKPGQIIDQTDLDVLEIIRRSWRTWTADPPPQRLDSFLLTRGVRTINKVVSLVFANAERSPRLVVKIARVAESIQALDREAASLRAVQTSRADRVSGIPRVLFLETWGGHRILGETALTGRPLYTVLRRDNCHELAMQVTRWLVALADRATPQPRAAWWDRLVEPVVGDFERRFGAVVDSHQLHATRALLATLGDLPLVCEQRDCSPWNVLIADNGELAILDWESAELRGLPALDLIYFLTYLSLFLDGAMESKRFRETYRAALSPATFTGSLLAECLNYYADQVGLDRTALAPLRLFAWLLHAHSEYKLRLVKGAAQPDSTALQDSLFLSLWQEELAHARAHG